MNKAKVFGKIVYFIFTFAIGILLAVVLPYLYMFYGESLENMSDALSEGRYADAMSLVGGYYNSQYVYQQDFPKGGGIVLFEATTLVYSNEVEENPDSDKEFVDESKLQKVYAGFVYGVQSTFSVYSLQNNQTSMMVTNLQGQSQTVSILDYDHDGDGTLDSIATMDQKGFFFIEVDQDTFGSLRSLQFVDCNGQIFATVDLSSKSLDFSQDFFVDVDAFLQEYNRDYTSEKCIELDKEFRAKNPNYKISSYGDTTANADKRASVTVVIYFLCVYVFADFIFGSFYIVRFFKWILTKVFKVKFKTKPSQKQSDAFGGDYFCKVTYVLDRTSAPEYDQSVQIHYFNGENEALFVLMQSNDYTASQRIKAGSYVNLHIDLDKDYILQDIPETLVAEGYQKTITIKLLKREE